MGRNVIQFKDKDNNVYDVKDVVARTTKADVIINNTESAPVTSVKDAMGDMPVKTLEVQVDPVQDLHGYDNPWPAGGGINIWNEQWEQGSIDNSTGEDKSAATGIRCIGYIPVVPENSYYIYVGSSDSVRVYYYDSEKSFLTTDTAKNIVKTMPSNTYYIRIRSTGEYGDVYKNDISINYPATATSYAPYSNVCPISGWTSADVTRTGKNLLDESTAVLGNIDQTTGAEISSTSVKRCDYMPVKGGQNIYLTISVSMRIFWFTENKTLISNQVIASSSSIEVPENASFFRLVGVISAWDGNIMVNYSTTASAYELYSGETIEYEFPSEAGTVYGAKLTIHQDGTGTLVVDKGIVTDLSDKTWTAYATDNTFFKTNVSDAKENADIVCSAYRNLLAIGINTVVANGDDVVIFMLLGRQGELYIRDSRYATSGATALQESLDGVTLVYELATPVTYQLTNQQVVSLLKGVNNVWADTGNTAIEYATDTKLYIDGKIAELQALILES